MQVKQKCNFAFIYWTGYKSWRHPDLGSWFMRDLVAVIAETAHQEHLNDMLTKVIFLHAELPYVDNSMPWVDNPLYIMYKNPLVLTHIIATNFPYEPGGT